MRFTLNAGLCLALALPLAAQDLPAEGFGLSSLPYPGQSLALTLSSGELVTFDGLSVDRWDANGVHILQLAAFAPSVFGAAAAIDPSESYLVLGESSNGDLYRIDLAGGGSTLLANLAYNFDAAFVGPHELVVSAATCGFGCGNELWRLDAQTGATTLLANLDGPSGPVAADTAGNLFYATQDGSFPSFPDVTRVLYLTPGQLASNSLLLESDFGVLGTEFDGASSLVAGGSPFEVYLAQNDFGSGANRVYRVGATEASSELLVEGQTFNWISGLEFEASTTGAAWAPYQPGSGGSLRYTTTDFFSIWERSVLHPERPVASLSGPGLAGSGPVDFSVDGLPPSGLLFVLYGPSALLGANEIAVPVGATPFFTALDLGTVQLLPFVLGADASGHAEFSFQNSPALAGVLALQAAAADLFADVKGSSTTVVN